MDLQIHHFLALVIPPFGSDGAVKRTTPLP